MRALFFLFVSINLLAGVFSYTVPLPPGVVVENLIEVGGGNFLMSDVASGNVLLFNFKTNQFYTVVTAPKGRVIQGLAYYKKLDLIITAGSQTRYINSLRRGLDPTPNVGNITFPDVDVTSINIYEKTTGKPYTSCVPDGAGLIKDVTIDRNEKYAYFSDAVDTAFYQMDLSKLPSCQFKRIPLPFYEPFATFTSYTGIAAYRNGVIINSFSAQLSMFVNPKTEKVTNLSVGVGFNDGLKVRGNCLFSVDALAESESINVYHLYKNKSSNFSPSAVLKRNLEDPTLSQSTGLALYRKNMIISNVDMDIMGKTGALYLTVVKLPAAPFGTC